MAGTNGAKVMFPAGGGAFALPRLSLGIFHVAQPTHQLAVGSDKLSHIPLHSGQGWIQPAGSEGLCVFDDAGLGSIVEFDTSTMTDFGIAVDDPGLLFVGTLDPLLVHLAQAVVEATTAPRLYRDTMEQAIAAQMASCLRGGRVEIGKPVGDARLSRTIAFIEDNLDKDIALADLASLAAMSPFHFSRSFKAATGKSPLQFVIAARLDRARLLLRTTRLPVAEVAYRVGYEDVSRFGQHFRRAVGASPGVYRLG